MKSHTPSFWLWDDPEACHRRFELVHGLEDKRKKCVHTERLSHILRDCPHLCLSYRAAATFAELGCDGAISIAS